MLFISYSPLRPLNPDTHVHPVIKSTEMYKSASGVSEHELRQLNTKLKKFAQHCNSVIKIPCWNHFITIHTFVA